ncbi:hypothetical protein [Pseudomonas sp. PB101]|uniref:hypothetical protein n=1 Tax=Pseudomonas sp. PB101 TaxID=2495428 RepID=UPI0013666F04|nr:hypothetical protein [Pseudomonas sp. PB101]
MAQDRHRRQAGSYKGKPWELACQRWRPKDRCMAQDRYRQQAGSYKGKPAYSPLWELAASDGARKIDTWLRTAIASKPAPTKANLRTAHCGSWLASDGARKIDAWLKTAIAGKPAPTGHRLIGKKRTLRRSFSSN